MVKLPLNISDLPPVAGYLGGFVFHVFFSFLFFFYFKGPCWKSLSLGEVGPLLALGLPIHCTSQPLLFPSLSLASSVPPSLSISPGDAIMLLTLSRLIQNELDIT